MGTPLTSDFVLTYVTADGVSHNTPGTLTAPGQNVIVSNGVPTPAGFGCPS